HAVAHDLLAGPGIPVAVGGRIERAEADAGEQAHQQHQAPVDAQDLLGERELAWPAEVEMRDAHEGLSFGSRTGRRRSSCRARGARGVAFRQLDRDVGAGGPRPRRAAADALATMLPYHSADVARRTRRRERDEERVVTLDPGYLLRLPHAMFVLGRCDVPHLR